MPKDTQRTDDRSGHPEPPQPLAKSGLFPQHHLWPDERLPGGAGARLMNFMAQGATFGDGQASFGIPALLLFYCVTLGQ